jgi:hypothetical protein
LIADLHRKKTLGAKKESQQAK